jgi:hypothetical protein
MKMTLKSHFQILKPLKEILIQKRSLRLYRKLVETFHNVSECKTGIYLD